LCIKDKLFYPNGKMIAYNRKQLKIKYPKILDSLMHETDFLSLDCHTVARVYCLFNEIYKQPTCKICNKPVSYRKTNGFHIYCSGKCCNSDPDNIENRKQSCMNKYGVEFVMQSEEIKAKSRKICFW